MTLHCVFVLVMAFEGGQTGGPSTDARARFNGTTATMTDGLRDVGSVAGTIASPASKHNSLESDLLLLAIRRVPCCLEDLAKATAAKDLLEVVLLLLLEALGLCQQVVAQLGSETHVAGVCAWGGGGGFACVTLEVL